MNSLPDLIRSKNHLLIQVESQPELAFRKVQQITSEASVLEGRIAALLIADGRVSDAVINLVSQASCLIRSQRLLEAKRVFIKARGLAEAKRLCDWLDEQIKDLPADPVRGTVFSAATSFIEDNERLRRPQQGAYKAAVAHFAGSNNHAIIQLPVGCGKTGTMAILPFGVAKGRVLVVAPNLEIRRNLTKNFDYSNDRCFWKTAQVLRNGASPSCAELDSEANILDCDNADIVVTNIQQLVASSSKKWLSKLPDDYFDAIFLDEGHHNVAPTWKGVIERFASAKITSFTATPIRSDGQKVEGTRIYHFPISEAIREGYVKDIAARSLEPIEIEFEFRGETRRHTLAEVMKLREEAWFSRGVALAPECNKSIVDASIQCMKELREGSGQHHQIIAVACSIDHAKAICALYVERNINAEVLHSDMPSDKQEEVRSKIESGVLDAIVQIQMLNEGADYPKLSVAAIFRPYRHIVPYVQFVGRVMRVITQDKPFAPENRGFVVSHVGLNVDKWWKELQELDDDDKNFFGAIYGGQREFYANQGDTPEVGKRRLFQPEMKVIKEQIDQVIEERFLKEESQLRVDDLISTLLLRGIDVEDLGMSREDLEVRLFNARVEQQVRKPHEPLPVQPQKARQVARRRLKERVLAAAKQLLNELSLPVSGFDLPRKFPGVSVNNLTVAIVLLNTEVQLFLNVGKDERDLLSEDQLKRAHDSIDEIINRVAKKIRAKS